LRGGGGDVPKMRETAESFSGLLILHSPVA
jgi:hypothetical protein